MAVNPAHTEMVNVSSPHSDGSNPILARLGLNFSLVANVFGYTDGCGTPILPQKVHIVPTPHPVDSPVAVKQLVNTVLEAQSREPTPFTSHIPQASCCCFNDSVNGLLADQTFTDSQGVETFSFKEINPFCGLLPCFPRRIKSFNAQKDLIGHLEWRNAPCGVQLMTCLCGVCCRTATLPEWTWLSAVDGAEQERLSFRTPAQEGQCFLLQICCNCPGRSEQGCCAILPDVPFHNQMTLYGPTGQPGALGSVEVRGAYGWDKCCGCIRYFGIRPELVTSLRLNQPLPFAETVLAMQMGQTIADTASMVRDYRTGRLSRLQYLKPAQMHMG